MLRKTLLLVALFIATTGPDLVGYISMNAIYAVMPERNLILEVVAECDEEVDDFSATNRDAAVVASPESAMPSIIRETRRP